MSKARSRSRSRGTDGVFVPPSVPAPIVSGGAVTISGGVVTHTCTANDTINVWQAGTCDWMLVGAGAAGGFWGGGGGGGKVLTGSAIMLAVGSYPIVIGVGGTPSGAITARGGNGAASTFNGNSATGGGGGGSQDASVRTGAAGGNGGGGAYDSGGTGGVGEQFNGGAASSGQGTGGGGGAAQAGANASGNTGGKGGDGFLWVDGNRYGAGGGGSARSDDPSPVAGVGGAGGGGNGGNAAAGSNATANTGSGGGGGGRSAAGPTNFAGGAGADGVFKIRYSVADLLAGQYALGGTITVDGNYIRHTFNSSSTLAPTSNVKILSITDGVVVAGGGGGDWGIAGGGGGGGVNPFATTNVFSAQTVTIGTGGVAGLGVATQTQANTPGGNSAFGSVTAVGGGEGGGYGGAAGVGGSGGGMGGGAGASGAAGTGGQGNAGGNSYNGVPGGAGGGGGGSAAGANGTVSNGGAGGAGTEWPAGSGTRYGGGGGGGGYITGSNYGAGGSGGGGHGATRDALSVAGTANTGGGGGGGGWHDGGAGGAGACGANGGSGIVIVRYLPGSVNGGYEGLLRYQGATNYWPFQTARLDTQTEADVIGSKTMTMSGGDVPVLSAGDGPLSGPVAATDRGITFVLADTERMTCSTAAFDTRQNWSYSAWYRSSSMTGNGPVLMYLRGGSPQPYLMLMHRDDRGGLVAQIDSGGGAQFFDPGSYTFADGNWHHCGITRAYSATNSLDTWALYLDGVQIGTASAAAIGITATGTGSSMTWSIAGRDDGDANVFGGDVAHAEFAVGVTLTAAQMYDQYQRGL